MFTEYALNGLLKQTYARAPFPPPFPPPHPATPVGRPRATGIYHGQAWRKLRDLARNLSAPMEKVGGESPSFVGRATRDLASPRLASHARLDRPIFLRAPPLLLPFIPRRIQNPSPDLLQVVDKSGGCVVLPSFLSTMKKARRV